MQKHTIPFDLESTTSHLLTAGPLSCLYENGNLVQIRLGRQEVLQKIYAAVRLHNWDTAPAKIADEQIVAAHDHFEVSYTAEYRMDKPIFRGRFLIRGTADGTLSFQLEGEVLEAFSRMRIGLCILHPLEGSKGAKATVTRPDSSEYEAAFPVDISPELPFTQIAALCWKDNYGNKLKLDFQGDIFETEDQRNWSDNSFKTYSTPSSLERPVSLIKGEKINQSVGFSSTAGKNSRSVRDDEKQLTNLPLIGYTISPDSEPDQLFIDGLRQVPLHHLRTVVDLNVNNWFERLNKAVSLAKLLDARLELVLKQTENLASFLQKSDVSDGIYYSILPVCDVQAYPSVYRRLKDTFPAALVGFGTDNNFSDLNENRPGSFDFDFLSFGITPQAHARDNRTIVENLYSHTDLLRTAQSFADGKPIHAGPITLIDKSLSTEPDTRQYSHFLAAWALHTIQNLAACASLTVFDAWGANGLLKNGQEKPENSAFFDYLKILKDFGATKVLSSSRPGAEIIFENATGDKLMFESSILQAFSIH